MRTLLCIFVLTFTGNLLAQNGERQNWYFGYNAGLNFSTSPPTVLTNGKVINVNASAVMSDQFGNLLFYSDGHTIWNRKHEVMTNGDQLDGYSGNYSQQIVIVRHPSSATRYFVFHISNPVYPVHSHRLNYSVVNMDNGDGIVEEKNVRLATDDLLVKIATVEIPGNLFWVIVQATSTGKYFSFRGTANGIDPNAVITDTAIPNQGNYDYGDLRFSPGGEMLASSNAYSGRVTIFKLNYATGLLTDAINVQTQSFNSIEFSPDGNLLYATTIANCSTNQLFQFDVTNYSSEAVNGSMLLINSTSNIGMLQRGPDGRIYVGRRSPVDCNFHDYLGTIDQPNVRGTGCSFNPSSIFLGGKSTWQGLPQFSEIASCPNFVKLPPKVSVCNDNQYTFSLPGNLNVLWDDGSAKVIRTVHKEGVYWVQTGVGAVCLKRDTVRVEFVSFKHPQIKDTTLCGMGEYTIDLTSLACNYQWANGSVAPEMKATVSGTYSVTLEKNGCSKSFDIHITLVPKIEFDKDSLFILHLPIVIKPVNEPEAIVWQDGTTDGQYPVTKLGRYSFRAVLKGCTYKDTVVVALRDIFVPNVITPNNDGINDSFSFIGMKSGETWGISIFNRSGHLVYANDTYHNEWTGDGISEVYFYKLVNTTQGFMVRGWLQVLK